MPTRRPSEPVAPATIPGQPLDPKIQPDQSADNEEVGRQEHGDVGTDERRNEMLSANLQRVPAKAGHDPVATDAGQFGGGSTREKQIPDRSAEPAVLDSLDPAKSTSAASSDDVAPDAAREARDDEGNAVEATGEDKEVEKPKRPDSDAGSQ